MTQTSSPTKLRVAVLGCGRMGARHARNVAYFTPRAELVAVVDPSDKAQQWARENLPAGVE
jgi:myo-inositol 2-dehydrogenase/D-chiro-inositol 1-dehydrogenase